MAPVLCSICMVTDQEELIEPVLTGCAHLFCWTCLWNAVKAKGDFECPMCRLFVSVVTADLTRGKYRTDQEQIESRIPRRPAQGVFPFNFEAVQDGVEPVALETSQPDVDPPQPVRRSERARRQNSLLRDYEVNGQRANAIDDQELEGGEEPGDEVEGGEEPGDEVEGGEEPGDEVDIHTDSGGEESTSGDELPEMEPRFMAYHPPSTARHHIIGEDSEETEVDEDEIEFIEENLDHNREELSYSSDNRDLLNHSRDLFNHSSDLLNHSMDDPRPHHIVEENVDTDRNVTQPQPQRQIRYNSKNIVPGTQITHIELALTCVHQEMLNENVKIVALNFTTLARAARDRYRGSFPNKSVAQISKYIGSILTKATRNFETDSPILPRILRADDDRNKRMQDCMSAIIRMDSAAPAPVTRHIRTRGVARRPRAVERPVIPAPGVGRIATTDGSSRTDADVIDAANGTPGGASQTATSSDRLPRAGSASSEMGDTQENFSAQRRQRQEQGAELREQSLGQMPNRRLNNNRRLGAQLDQFSDAIQNLANSRQAAGPSSRCRYFANINRRQDNRERSRSMEREERRTMDLLLVAHATNNKELASSVSVGRELTVFKKVDEDELDLSPEFPITLKLTDIAQVSRELKEYLEVDEAVAGLVTKDRNNHTTIVTAVDMVNFSEATVEIIDKRNKKYIILSEKL